MTESTSGAKRKRSSDDFGHAALKKIDTGFRVPGGTKRKRCDGDEELVPFKKADHVSKTPQVRIHYIQTADGKLTIMHMRSGALTVDMDTTYIDASAMFPPAATTGFAPELLAKFQEMPIFVADDEEW